MVGAPAALGLSSLLLSVVPQPTMAKVSARTTARTSTTPNAFAPWRLLCLDFSLIPLLPLVIRWSCGRMACPLATRSSWPTRDAA